MNMFFGIQSCTFFLLSLYSGSKVWEGSRMKPMRWHEFPFREITLLWWYVSRHIMYLTLRISELGCLFVTCLLFNSHSGDNVFRRIFWYRHTLKANICMHLEISHLVWKETNAYIHFPSQLSNLGIAVKHFNRSVSQRQLVPPTLQLWELAT